MSRSCWTAVSFSLRGRFEVCCSDSIIFRFAMIEALCVSMVESNLGISRRDFSISFEIAELSLLSRLCWMLEVCRDFSSVERVLKISFVVVRYE